ncbi:hypothetical protein GCM10022393_27690 [Aquimarina addita]|uniref:Gamma-glutamylcyclotransferase n=1 Tax=Aquimarina addita TaxID=870485 RepID=A0ABP6UQ02_9FLAO
MPKPYTAPLLIDQQKTLSTGYLSKRNYFLPNYKVTGSTGWTSNKSKDLDITITTIMKKGNEVVILNYYDFNSEPVEQVIYLQSEPSNLGKGLVWFFICPFSGKRCRNLIFVYNRFMHRSNIPKAMYTVQSESKYWRKLFQLQPNIPKTQKILNEPNRKYYKKYYCGKITKRYKKYLVIIQKWNTNRDERIALMNR